MTRCEMVPLTFSPLPFGYRYLFAQREDAGFFLREEVDILGVAVVEEYYLRGTRDLEIGGEDKPAGRHLYYVITGDGQPEIADDFFQGVENVEPVAVLRPGESADVHAKQFDAACRDIERRMAKAKQERVARRNGSNPPPQTEIVLEEVCR